MRGVSCDCGVRILLEVLQLMVEVSENSRVPSCDDGNVKRYASSFVMLEVSQ